MALFDDPLGDVGLFHLFWNWIGRSQEEIVQARRDWMEGTRFGEVKGYDGDPRNRRSAAMLPRCFGHSDS
ncbi:hypothetical protein [Streptomyces cahuitamycinicus]|uniref:Uncharacterized protein n=1 Tax=Streptomyces cahuitamycinicus TaxID=2070367 RepID=A0A2N8THS6_9ACTN|nr:hypothetical protein [Streptomyces cahuitamycinicus]PNG18582.1 hypothetical protein C1J00_30315 [Streptomyces cahuitamycinicus]